MKRRVLAVTGSRAEYGAMRPVFRAIASSPALALDMLVTGMHLAPQFRASLAEIEADDFSSRHVVDVRAADGSGLEMARALGEGVQRMAEVVARTAPDVVLVQGDRGEMLAAAMAAAHLNVPVVHMSGGDHTGSIDDAIRNAITAFAHVHLTTCAQSSQRLLAMGEAAGRVFEVGEPALDVILALEPMPSDALAAELRMDLHRPFALATQHPVTTEADAGASQITETLEALAQLRLPTVFTYPNTDAGCEAMTAVLESWRGRDFLRVVPHLGSQRYLSLMRVAAVLVGNSSSGIIEASSFRLPVVNIGTRQHRRTRAANVIDAAYDRVAIRAAIERALGDSAFRAGLALCRNPYGDGTCAARTADILARLRITPTLTAKWLDRGEPVIDG
jgi:GDP/UDP-N,N'-diacetylbacillosamine 2-epimerase (hydrolysing)